MEPKTNTTECHQIVDSSLPPESRNECIGDISTDTTEKDVSLTTPAASPLDMNVDEDTVSTASQMAEEDELLLANENDASDVESINENADINLQKVELVTDSPDDISDAQETCILPEKEEEQGKEQVSLLFTDDTEEIVSIDDECTDEIVGIRKVASSQSNDDTKVVNDEESSLPSNTGTDVSSINDDDEEDLNLIDNQSEPLLTKEKEDIKANFKIILESIPDKGCFGCEDYTDTEEDRNACIDIFKLVDSIESRDASERDANEKDELSDDSSSNSRKVKFHKDVVTSVRRSPRWTPEEKSFLFYTGREMYSFRMEYILELNEGQDIKHEEWQKFQGRGHLRLFGLYTLR